MATRRTFISGADLEVPLRALRAALRVPDEFGPDVLAAAASASWSRDSRTDATDIPLVTLDPEGSRDLDQAFALQSVGSGLRFHYAIADVGAFVAADGPLAAEAAKRGETLYLPDGRTPLYPTVLSEGAASLLPDGERPAVLWRLDLDADAEPRKVEVRRAIVRSRAQLDYQSFETADPDSAVLLRRFGELRARRERERGGISLNIPEQDVVPADGGGWELESRTPVAAEDWNAQLSLLVGMAAATMMIDAKIGLLRTMPKPWHRTVGSLHRTAAALGIGWPEGTPYAQVIRGLDPAKPAHAAMIRLASALFRGAGYVAFDGEVPAQTRHAAVAAPYAHATAPLRRLADRFVSEVCLAVSADVAVPDWARSGLPQLPHLMAAADNHAHQVDRAVVNLAETVLMQDRVGEVFDGVIVEVEGDHGEIQLREPAVRARIDGSGLPLGHSVSARLATAEVKTRTLVFVPA
ncbi:MAG TPA: RNB domain-containing ribonuclease [Mycobacteriales bacterium]|nr:RNB domain-containing ribonuclease [Mycobacteriales bacterium]